MAVSDFVAAAEELGGTVVSMPIAAAAAAAAMGVITVERVGIWRGIVAAK